MKSLALILLLLVSASFSSYAGRMVAKVEKEWNILSNGTLRDVVLNASFLVESPYQSVIRINVSDGEIARYGDEIRILYRAESLRPPKKITATAVVETRYQPVMESNPPLPGSSLPGSEYTRYTPEMEEFARSHTSESEGQLDAMALLTEWVHKNVHYDTSLWGSSAPAPDVYESRKAVCVGYTHLLIALANSLGIESRYVSGYVFAGSATGQPAGFMGWQEHAWAEFRIGDRWIPVDPTFQEFGFLDARRIASRYSQDQSGAVDKLIAKGSQFSFDSSTQIQISESAPFPPLTAAYAAFDGTEFSAIISNPGNNYATPTYTIAFPPHIHREESGILFLRPGERKALSYRLDTSSLGNAVYSVPYMISMQGTEISDSITVSRSRPPVSRPDAYAACMPTAILISTMAFVLIRARNTNA